MKAHWTFRYLINKIKYLLNSYKNKNAPWISHSAIKYLSEKIIRSNMIFEWGSGRSTKWFSDRCHGIISVEHDKQWYDIVKQELINNKNTTILLKEDNAEYEGSINDYPDCSFDLIVVDGIRRSWCANNAVNKLKPGGMLLLDDAHRYLPSDSCAPYALKNWSDQKDTNWLVFKDKILGWEQLWFKDGISDTLILIKP